MAIVPQTDPGAVSTSSPAGATYASRWLNGLVRQGNLLLAGLVLSVIALIVLPIPLFLLDTLIVANIAVSVALLMTSFYLPSALAFPTFPSLLLFTTLFRLALNIAATKRILLGGDAGHVIDAFGRLVVGGNVVVGLVVFVIIALVQFIVIAKGAERVAEVGARFTLDAMPGKQMSIDADLRSGIIAKTEARRRRTELEQESRLYGAMDGAMKFVKGDAIASMIIAVVNIVGGIAIGMVVHDSTLALAVSQYTILTVGEGMVSQLPSLFVSIAAGIIITRVGTAEEGGGLGAQVVRQAMNHPGALILAGLILCAFLLVPGFPRIQFGLFSAVLMGVGYLVWTERKRPLSHDRSAMSAMASEGVREAPQLIDDAVSPMIAPLTVRLSPDLRGVLMPQAFNAALERERTQVRRDLGVPFPGLRMHYDSALLSGGYAIDIQELPAREGLWRDLSSGGVAPEDRLASELAEIMRGDAEFLVGVQEVQAMLARAEGQIPALVAEVQRNVPVARVAEVMRRLLQERVSIRHLREICESLITWGPREADIVMLTEYVRVELGRFIVRPYVDPSGRLRAVILGGMAESAVRGAIQQGAGGSFLAMPEDTTQALLAQAELALPPAASGDRRVVLCSMEVRRFVKKLLDARFPDITVLSFQELPARVEVDSVGVIELGVAPAALRA